MVRLCLCKTLPDGSRVDLNNLPLWHKMEGCPVHDYKLYTPIIPPKPKETGKGVKDV